MNAMLDRRGFLWCAVAVPAALLPMALVLQPWLVAALAALWLVALAAGLRQRLLPIAVRLPLTLVVAALALAAYDFRFGRDTGAALLSTMLVLKLLELRRVRDARSVLGFALFATMSAFLLDQGPALLATAAIGCVVVLSALADVADRAAGTPLRQPVRTRVLATLKMLALSLPLAAAGFFLFPRLASPLWGVPGKATESRTGLTDEMAPGDIAALYVDDSPALRVRFEGAAPPRAAMYWRGPVLSQFDGRTWTRALYRDRANLESVEPRAATVRYTITQEPTDRRYVLALDVPVAAPEGVTMQRQRTLMVRRPLDRVTRFELESAVAYTLAERLPYPNVDREHYTALPGQFNPRTRALVADWTADDPDPNALVRRALDWFGREFRYTLEPQLLGRDSVDEFLFEQQAGYCEHFASAFTVMMRMGGVPARVVTGYQGGYFNPIGGHWVVRHSDAHAWSEVWLQGRGWVRVDPTSAVAPSRIESGLEGLQGRTADSAWWAPLRNASDWMLRNWNDVVLGFDAARQRRLLQPFGVADADWRALGAAFALAAGVALLVTLTLVLRERGPRVDPLVLAYRRFLQRLARAGAARLPHEPPLAFAERAATLLPADAATLRALSRRYAQWRYAPVPLDAAGQRELARQLRAFRATRRAIVPAHGGTP